jgi:uncharacterized surface protein with fasciclin (FAS1) repeats
MVLAGMLAAIAPRALASPERFLVDLAPTERPDPTGDVLNVAAAEGHFTHFLAMVHSAGFEDTLRGPGPFTLFAPTDAAFRDMNQQTLARLMQPTSHEELRSVLGYHIVRGQITTDTAHGRTQRLRTLNGYNVNIDGSDGIRVNGQLVAAPDIEASNGVIQGINTVLSPPVMVASSG